MANSNISKGQAMIYSPDDCLYHRSFFTSEYRVGFGKKKILHFYSNWRTTIFAMSCDENRSKTTHNNIGNKVKDNHSLKCNLAIGPRYSLTSKYIYIYI
jgi:hypothetical protein